MSRENLQVSANAALSRLRKLLRLRDQEIVVLKGENKDLKKQLKSND